MTKADLVEQVHEAIGPGVTKKDCAAVIDAFLNAVKLAIANGGNTRSDGKFDIDGAIATLLARPGSRRSKRILTTSSSRSASSGPGRDSLRPGAAAARRARRVCDAGARPDLDDTARPCGAAALDCKRPDGAIGR